LLNKAALYFHTVRHLRVVQVLARVWFGTHKPRADVRPAPALRTVSGIYVAPIAATQSLVAEDVYRFLNVERRCVSRSDWTAPEASKLWRYNLHYFDYLNAVGSLDRIAWHKNTLERWVAENPPGYADGWEPYPTSRRIVNWIKWGLQGNALSSTCRESLAVQARWLNGRLEYHILGNHLLANAKALVYAGSFFDGPEAGRWQARGMKILDEQINEQVLADGGHFELSPMYHATVLEDLLDLVNVLRAYNVMPPEQWLKYNDHMHYWLQNMTHPDGEIAFFNDAAFGIAPTFAQLSSYAERLELPLSKDAHKPTTALRHSGYVRASTGAAHLVCDCAQVGPDYLPGHAHADTLSFELSLGGQRVFVNSGTSVYGNDNERQRQRGTAAHNTVIVDGLDSSEVWGGFRVARRARAKLITVQDDQDVGITTIEASHDGYRRLKGRVEHRRRWVLNDHSLCIEDKLSGRFDRAEARFHLHPAVDARAIGPNEIELFWATSVRIRISFSGADAVVVGAGTWHPEFGLTVENKYISVQFAENLLTTHISWGLP
jgi:uncharacterized heparinase superfamily protein